MKLKNHQFKENFKIQLVDVKTFRADIFEKYFADLNDGPFITMIIRKAEKEITGYEQFWGDLSRNYWNGFWREIAHWDILKLSQ